MSFSTVTIAGQVATAPNSAGPAAGSFSATLTGNADGTVSGTWTYTGQYSDANTSGVETLNGTLTGTGGGSGPWTLVLGGAPVESPSATLTLAGNQFSLAVAGGFGASYLVASGYDGVFEYFDHFRFQGTLTAAAPSQATPGPDSLVGTAANESFNGGGGNDTIDGGAGIDTAVFNGPLANYTIAAAANGYTVTDKTGADGTDTLVNIERLQFSDAHVAIDVQGDGGMAYRLYQAAFGRVPDIGGLGFQMNALDNGLTLSQVAGNFIASPEFQATYGNVDNTQFVTLLYQNVLHRAPDAGGLQFHLDEIAGGQSRADVLSHFSESPENQANVIGAIQNGMVFTV